MPVCTRDILQNIEIDLDDLKKSIEDAVRSTGGTITVGTGLAYTTAQSIIIVYDVSNFQGGGSNPATRIISANLTQQNPISIISSSELDVSQIYLIEGISPENKIVSEQVQLNGISPVVTIEETWYY